MNLSLAELAARFDCATRGDPDTRVDHVATLQNATSGGISFLSNAKYKKFLGATQASIVILEEKYAEISPVPVLIAANPYAVYAQIAQLLHPLPAVEAGIHGTAVVSGDAQVSASASVGPLAVIDKGARIGDRVLIGPGCLVGRHALVGDDCRLTASVTLCHDVVLGQRCILHPGVVIGSDGFGMAQAGDRWIKVPQLGRVRIGDDVEIGSGTSIDRGSVEDTVIEDGVKLDNQIQVAHNVHIGAHTVIAAKVGISGSTKIGRRCLIAGKAGFVGHVEICDDVVITARTTVNRDISQPGVYSGELPMDEARRWRRNAARFRQLDRIAARVKALEKRLDSDKGDGDSD